MTKSNSENTSKKPTYIAYVVRSIGKDSYWDRIGAAWTHADGKGISLQLNAIPLTGEISLRAPQENE